MLTRGKVQSAELPKRFYKTAAAARVDGGWTVQLDGRAVRTPKGARLTVPSEPLAALLAQEWAAQDEVIAIGDMPATRLAFTVADRGADVREGLADEIARWAGSDVLCYFAEAPDKLVERELHHWGPVLEWAESELGVELVRASGVTHQPQPPETLERVRTLALELGDFELMGLAMAAGLFGSAILAFAVQRDQLGGEAALELSRLDEAFQEEQWGVDAEAAERTDRMRRDALMLERWFEALH